MTEQATRDIALDSPLDHGLDPAIDASRAASAPCWPPRRRRGARGAPGWTRPRCAPTSAPGRIPLPRYIPAARAVRRTGGAGPRAPAGAEPQLPARPQAGRQRQPAHHRRKGAVHRRTLSVAGADSLARTDHRRQAPGLPAHRPARLRALLLHAPGRPHRLALRHFLLRWPRATRCCSACWTSPRAGSTTNSTRATPRCRTSRARCRFRRAASCCSMATSCATASPRPARTRSACR